MTISFITTLEKIVLNLIIEPAIRCSNPAIFDWKMAGRTIGLKFIAIRFNTGAPIGIRILISPWHLILKVLYYLHRSFIYLVWMMAMPSYTWTQCEKTIIRFISRRFWFIKRKCPIEKKGIYFQYLTTNPFNYLLLKTIFILSFRF